MFWTWPHVGTYAASPGWISRWPAAALFACAGVWVGGRDALCLLPLLWLQHGLPALD
jgi:hypothetical protein